MANQHTGGPGPVALQHRDQVLEQLRAGKRLSDIAPSLGVSTEALSRPLRDDPEYRSALEHSFELRIDRAEDGILAAAQQVDVSRASAYHKAISWRAGVECARWQAKSQLDVHHSGPLVQITVSSVQQEYAPRITDVMSNAETQHSNVIEHDAQGDGSA
jgi:hypothetical protein